MGKSTVAFMHTDVATLVGGGGAQRFFIDVFRNYRLQENPRFRLIFLTDRISYNNLCRDRDYSPFSRYILPLRSPNNRFNNFIGNFDIFFKIIFYRIRLIHICQYYHPTHYRRLKFIQRLPAFIRPKIVVNWIHCNFPFEYFIKDHVNYDDHHQRFDPLFNEIKIDGIFSWYSLFKTFTEENKIIKSKPLIHAIETYCCNTGKFKPHPVKENLVVWAARLTHQKNPLMFIEAVRLLEKTNHTEVKNWKFMICGNGPLTEEVRAKIKEYGLGQFIEHRDDISDMSPILGRSKCFVSTQYYENFTSLSMNEALASGNVIVSRDVGQTGLYAREGFNAFLAKEDSVEGLSGALLDFFQSSPDKLEKMQANSLYLSNEVHTTGNFIKELDGFWSRLIK